MACSNDVFLTVLLYSSGFLKFFIDAFCFRKPICITRVCGELCLSSNCVLDGNVFYREEI